MNDDAKLRMLVIASRDQAWAEARGYENDIARITKDGPDGSEYDTLLVKAVFGIVLADLKYNPLEDTNH